MMAMAEGLPPVSPRLRSVLSEHFSLTMRCAPNAPITLDAAATAMPADAFGVASDPDRCSRSTFRWPYAARPTHPSPYGSDRSPPWKVARERAPLRLAL